MASHPSKLAARLDRAATALAEANLDLLKAGLLEDSAKLKIALQTVRAIQQKVRK